MPLSLPGALASVSAHPTTGVVTAVTLAGDTVAAGTVVPGSRVWLDEWSLVMLETPSGEQTRVGCLGGVPADQVYRGGATVNGSAPTAPVAPVSGRRWSGTVTTDATGGAVVDLPTGLFASVWAVHAHPVAVGGFVALTTVTAARVALQVWTGTGVLLGGATLAKPTAATSVLLEVSGPGPTPA